MSLFKNNCCDGIYNSFDVHFTNACDNKCAHCIDKRFHGVGATIPDVDAIVNTIVTNKDGIDDVLFLGGEPCLFLDELIEVVASLREQTNLKLFVTTAVPKICFDQKEDFFKLIEVLDGINLSVQHHNEDVADKIRLTQSKYDRQAFYRSLPHKNKIRINLNAVKPYLSTKEDLTACLRHYDAMGFGSIKLSEIQHGKDVYVSFANLFNIKMKSAYSHGCQTYMQNVLPDLKTPLLLKRSCFVCEDSLKATLLDGVKVISKAFIRPANKYGVVYANGQLTKGWV